MVEFQPAFVRQTEGIKPSLGEKSLENPLIFCQCFRALKSSSCFLFTIYRGISAEGVLKVLGFLSACLFDRSGIQKTPEINPQRKNGVSRKYSS